MTIIDIIEPANCAAIEEDTSPIALPRLRGTLSLGSAKAAKEETPAKAEKPAKPAKAPKAPKAPKAEKPAKAPKAPKPAKPEKPAKVSVADRLAQIIPLLERPEGMARSEIEALTGWLPHRVSWIMSQLRKEGREIIASKHADLGTTYRIATEA